MTTRDDALIAELQRLGHEIPVHVPEPGLATAVLERVRQAEAPRDPAVGLRIRVARVAVAVLAVLVALLAMPPVRAAVAEWFGFAGVAVRSGPDLGSDAPPPEAVDGSLSVGEAAELVAFDVLVPSALGEPGAVAVSSDRRVMSMTWSTDDGPVRLDQFDGRLDFTIAKTSPGVQYAAVGGGDALWFDRPHEVVVLDEDDTPRTETARLAGHTLIWPVGNTTMRLEGDLELAEAVAIADSATAYAGD